MKNINKQQILILFLIGVPLLLTNGSFFALCEIDPTLAYIRWAGDCGFEVLKYTGYLSGAYFFANYMYNIHYCFPKTLDLIFLVKWLDRANGWLKFSNKGEIEKHLEDAGKTYSPLYADVKREIYDNILVPSYNNTIGSFLAYSGLKPSVRVEERVVYVPRPEPVSMPQNVPVITPEAVLAIENLSNAVNESNQLLAKATRLVEVEIGNKAGLVRLDFLAPYFQKEYYASIVRRDPYNNDLTPYTLLSELRKVDQFVIESLFLCDSREELARFPGKPNTTYYFKVIGRLQSEIDAAAQRKALNLSPKRKFDPGFCFYNIPIDENLTNNPDCGALRQFLTANPDLCSDVNLHFDAAGSLYTVTMPTYTNEEAKRFLNVYNEMRDSASALTQSSQSIILSYSSVAAVATFVTGTWDDLIIHLRHINDLVTLLHNPAAATLVANSLQQAGQIVPDFLNAFINNPSLPNPQDYLLPGEEIYNPNNVSQIDSTGGNVGGGSPSSPWGWKTGLALLAGAGVLYGGFYCYKNGINPFAMSDAASAIVKNDFSKYLNLK